MGAVPYALRRFLTQVQGWWPITRKAQTWGQVLVMAAIALFAVADGLAYGLTGHPYRVALVRVFLKDPGLVILGEASSRIDPFTEALLGPALDRLLRGRTAMIIAHRLASLERVDDVLVLENGRVIEHRSRSVLVADSRSRYARLRANPLVETLP